MIKTEGLRFSYGKDEVLRGIDLEIEKGSFVAVLGRNGSGKSTLAKHFNALLLPLGGKVYVDGIDTSDESRVFDIRSRVGMVFQNPDNQMVAVTVEDEVAFAPENLGVPSDQIRQRVDEALKTVGLEKYAKASAAHLSGGQKQRLSIAAALAMEPECIVFDEATSMLDPKGRAELLETIRYLVREKGITAILITHYMDEAVMADRVIVMDNGMAVLDGTPEEVFKNAELLRKAGLDVPQTVRLKEELLGLGIDIPFTLDIDECADAIIRLLGGAVSD